MFFFIRGSVRSYLFAGVLFAFSPRMTRFYGLELFEIPSANERAYIADRAAFHAFPGAETPQDKAYRCYIAVYHAF